MANYHNDYLYNVKFVQQFHGYIDHINYNCFAQNIDDAKRIARKAWETQHQRKVPHMFHLEVHRASSQNIEDLRVTTWLGKELAGADTMWKFIKTRAVKRGYPGAL